MLLVTNSAGKIGIVDSNHKYLLEHGEKALDVKVGDTMNRELKVTGTSSYLR